MDKAFIIGNYNFLGFHFCTRLLENGFEIIGVPSNIHYNQEELDHKRMAIGRNSNFSEESFNETILSRIHNPTLIIVDFYEFYISREKETLSFIDDVSHALRNHINNLKECGSKVIYLFPIQWLIERITSPEISSIIQAFNKEGVQQQVYYLPTIFGVWQPKEFIFQQTLLKNKLSGNNIQLSEREWKTDAIYAEDLVSKVLECVEDSTLKECILISEEEDLWGKCAKYLGINHSVTRKDTVYQSEIKVKKVPAKTNYKRALDIQKRHMELLALEES